MLADSAAVLLDEPFKGLDGGARAVAAAFVRGQAARRAVVCVTHDAADAGLLQRTVQLCAKMALKPPGPLETERLCWYDLLIRQNRRLFSVSQTVKTENRRLFCFHQTVKTIFLKRRAALLCLSKPERKVKRIMKYAVWKKAAVFLLAACMVLAFGGTAAFLPKARQAMAQVNGTQYDTLGAGGGGRAGRVGNNRRAA